MSGAVPADLWKKLTSTVGLVSVRHPGGTNVMAAEWSYFVNKQPMYASVVLAPGAATRTLIEQAGEFAVTLCAEDQAELADFAGSFSVAAVDKSTSELVTFGEPRATRTPWVTGGVVAVECELRQVVPLPVHVMYVGEVVAAHLPDGARRPLVKHGGMYALGEPVHRTAVVVAAQLRPDGVLRVAATAPPGDGPWRLSLLAPDGVVVPVGEHPAGEYGDLMVDLRVPPPLLDAGLPGWRVRVERDGAKAGYAAVR